MMSAPEPVAPARGESADGPAPSTNKIWLRALERTANLTLDSRRTLCVVVEEMARRQPRAHAALSDSASLTYGELAGRARRYARWAKGQGYARGDVIGLLAPNRPEYLAAWLGLTRAGLVVALLNTQLGPDALAHGLNVAQAKAVIADEALIERLPPRGGWTVHGLAALGQTLADISDRPLEPDETPVLTLADPALLIYTSGTTGLPKAAKVSHHRLMSWSEWFAGLLGASPSDRLYDCLPMYHSIGGVAAPGSMLVSGGSTVLRETFSVTAFWSDISRWDCTLFQYIGELCRYLLSAPPHPLERAHRLRLMCGNGLSGEVWTAFQDRFAIPKVLEFYAATEGNVSLYNVDGKPGAIGRVPGFLTHRFPLALVRYDPLADAPIRDDQGRCVPCPVGEPGEALGKVNSSLGSARFEGYTTQDDTAKKLMRDVFEPGDVWFRTGDLMRADAQGFYYFVDRVGDTFRWKGENVATTEVAAAVVAAPGVRDAAVYGVSVPGAEGRAGMATIVTGEGFDLDTLARTVQARLPAYARPLFLRLSQAIAMTETFKQKKSVLAAEGFDPEVVKDRLFLLTAEGYVPMDAAMFAAIGSGRYRL